MNLLLLLDPKVASAAESFFAGVAERVELVRALGLVLQPTVDFDFRNKKSLL